MESRNTSLYGLILSILAALIATVFFRKIRTMENSLIYVPSKEFNSMLPILRNKVQEIYFKSIDNFELNAWYVKSEEDKPTIIFCHGNADNITHFQDVAEFLITNGYGIFLFDYRGFGRSQGHPSESGLYTDLRSAIKYLKDRKRIDQSNIVLWGHSLGGAVVAEAAFKDTFKGVILQSTFTNLKEESAYLAKTGQLHAQGLIGKLIDKYPQFVPITQSFKTDQKIQYIKSPLLIAHAYQDDYIPYTMSEKLEELNPEAKLFISNEGDHYCLDWIFGEALRFMENLD